MLWSNGAVAGSGAKLIGLPVTTNPALAATRRICTVWQKVGVDGLLRPWHDSLHRDESSLALARVPWLVNRTNEAAASPD